jgi:hypothetical protein
VATILETGNHIAQNGDGNQRRICAEKFVDQVTQALEGKSPFTPINFSNSHFEKNQIKFSYLNRELV